MNKSFSIEIDRSIFNDDVISKTVYWFSSDFHITRKLKDNVETLLFIPNNDCFNDYEKNKVIFKFNQDLNDNKLRQIVERETKDIRTILYIKAFANNDTIENCI